MQTVFKWNSYINVQVKWKWDNTLLIDISAIKLWFIFRMEFFCLLWFIPIYLKARGGQQIMAHIFLAIFPWKHNYILKYGKVIYKGNEKSLHGRLHKIHLSFQAIEIYKQLVKTLKCQEEGQKILLLQWTFENMSFFYFKELRFNFTSKKDLD